MFGKGMMEQLNAVIQFVRARDREHLHNRIVTVIFLSFWEKRATYGEDPKGPLESETVKGWVKEAKAIAKIFGEEMEQS